MMVAWIGIQKIMAEREALLKGVGENKFVGKTQLGFCLGSMCLKFEVGRESGDGSSL